MNYKRHEVISLKSHPAFNERWIQDRIEEDPSILGLGELALIARERQQEHAGRLDLLLGSAEDATRYEVELMLGSTDPTSFAASNTGTSSADGIPHTTTVRS